MTNKISKFPKFDSLAFSTKWKYVPFPDAKVEARVAFIYLEDSCCIQDYISNIEFKVNGREFCPAKFMDQQMLRLYIDFAIGKRVFKDDTTPSYEVIAALSEAICQFLANEPSAKTPVAI